MLPALHTERLTLSPFAPADAPLVQRLAGDARIAATTAFIPHPYPDGLAKKWIATHLPDFLEQKNITLAIRARADGELLGAINLKLTLTARERIGELGYWIAVPFWNRGLCTEAALEMLRHGFNEWKLDVIRAHYFKENAASGRVMEKCGMKREGILPRSVLKNGVLRDTIRYSINRENFLNPNTASESNNPKPKPASMRIAVISDTHNRLPPQLLPRIAGADEIWHLGDVCTPDILTALEQLGKPLHVVLGNNDYYHWPLTLNREIAGVRCHLIHIPPPVAPPDCDLLLHGHTHIPRDETLGATRWLNPGAITFPKGGAPASFAWLTFESGQPPIWKIMLL